MHRPARTWWFVPAAALATAMVIGSLVSIVDGAMHHHHRDHQHLGHVHVGGPPADLSPYARRFFGPTEPDPGPTEGVRCDDGSRPETVQGKVPAADYESGRAADGYFCNARKVSSWGETGGYRVERYVDQAGHECAYWDSTLLWPHNVPNQGTEGPGTYVMDMSDPANPVHTDTLRTPAMQSPHESLRLNHRRGLLVAVMGYPT